MFYLESKIKSIQSRNAFELDRKINRDWVNKSKPNLIF